MELYAPKPRHAPECADLRLKNARIRVGEGPPTPREELADWLLSVLTGGDAIGYLDRVRARMAGKGVKACENVAEHTAAAEPVEHA